MRVDFRRKGPSGVPESRVEDGEGILSTPGDKGPNRIFEDSGTPEPS